MSKEQKEYQVSVPYSGYSRGAKILTVMAESPEEALERVQAGDYDSEVDMIAYRDDTEVDWEEAELS